MAKGRTNAAGFGGNMVTMLITETTTWTCPPRRN